MKWIYRLSNFLLATLLPISAALGMTGGPGWGAHQAQQSNAYSGGGGSSYQPSYSPSPMVVHLQNQHVERGGSLQAPSMAHELTRTQNFQRPQTLGGHLMATTQLDRRGMVDALRAETPLTHADLHSQQLVRALIKGANFSTMQSQSMLLQRLMQQSISQTALRLQEPAIRNLLLTHFEVEQPTQFDLHIGYILSQFSEAGFEFAEPLIRLLSVNSTTESADAYSKFFDEWGIPKNVSYDRTVHDTVSMHESIHRQEHVADRVALYAILKQNTQSLEPVNITRRAVELISAGTHNHKQDVRDSYRTIALLLQRDPLQQRNSQLALRECNHLTKPLHDPSAQNIAQKLFPYVAYVAQRPATHEHEQQLGHAILHHLDDVVGKMKTGDVRAQDHLQKLFTSFHESVGLEVALTANQQITAFIQRDAELFGNHTALQRCVEALGIQHVSSERAIGYLQSTGINARLLEQSIVDTSVSSSRIIGGLKESIETGCTVRDPALQQLCRLATGLHVGRCGLPEDQKPSSVSFDTAARCIVNYVKAKDHEYLACKYASSDEQIARASQRSAESLNEAVGSYCAISHSDYNLGDELPLYTQVAGAPLLREELQKNLQSIRDVSELSGIDKSCREALHARLNELERQSFRLEGVGNASDRSLPTSSLRENLQACSLNESISGVFGNTGLVSNPPMPSLRHDNSYEQQKLRLLQHARESQLEMLERIKRISEHYRLLQDVMRRDTYVIDNVLHAIEQSLVVGTSYDLFSKQYAVVNTDIRPPQLTRELYRLKEVVIRNAFDKEGYYVGYQTAGQLREVLAAVKNFKAELKAWQREGELHYVYSIDPETGVLQENNAEVSHVCSLEHVARANTFNRDFSRVIDQCKMGRYTDALAVVRRYNGGPPNREKMLVDALRSLYTEQCYDGFGLHKEYAHKNDPLYGRIIPEMKVASFLLRSPTYAKGRLYPELEKIGLTLTQIPEGSDEVALLHYGPYPELNYLFYQRSSRKDVVLRNYSIEQPTTVVERVAFVLGSKSVHEQVAYLDKVLEAAAPDAYTQICEAFLDSRGLPKIIESNSALLHDVPLLSSTSSKESGQERLLLQQLLASDQLKRPEVSEKSINDQCVVSHSMLGVANRLGMARKLSAEEEKFCYDLLPSASKSKVDLAKDMALLLARYDEKTQQDLYNKLYNNSGIPHFLVGDATPCAKVEVPKNLLDKPRMAVMLAILHGSRQMHHGQYEDACKAGIFCVSRALSESPDATSYEQIARAICDALEGNADPRILECDSLLTTIQDQNQESSRLVSTVGRLLNTQHNDHQLSSLDKTDLNQLLKRINRHCYEIIDGEKTSLDRLERALKRTDELLNTMQQEKAEHHPFPFEPKPREYVYDDPNQPLVDLVTTGHKSYEMPEEEKDFLVEQLRREDLPQETRSLYENSLRFWDQSVDERDRELARMAADMGILAHELERSGRSVEAKNLWQGAYELLHYPRIVGQEAVGIVRDTANAVRHPVAIVSGFAMTLGKGLLALAILHGGDELNPCRVAPYIDPMQVEILDRIEDATSDISRALRKEPFRHAVRFGLENVLCHFALKGLGRANSVVQTLRSEINGLEEAGNMGRAVHEIGATRALLDKEERLIAALENAINERGEVYFTFEPATASDLAASSAQQATRVGHQESRLPMRSTQDPACSAASSNLSAVSHEGAINVEGVSISGVRHAKTPPSPIIPLSKEQLRGLLQNNADLKALEKVFGETVLKEALEVARINPAAVLEKGALQHVYDLTRKIRALNSTAEWSRFKRNEQGVLCQKAINDGFDKIKKQLPRNFFRDAPEFVTFSEKDLFAILEGSSELRSLDCAVEKLKKTTSTHKPGEIYDKLSVPKACALELQLPERCERIRLARDDIHLIARNTGISESTIAKIKNHLFIEEHILDGKMERFAPDIDLLSAWERLVRGDFFQCDLCLLQHELAESLIMKGTGIDYNEAHKVVQKIYNWEKSFK